MEAFNRHCQTTLRLCKNATRRAHSLQLNTVLTELNKSLPRNTTYSLIYLWHCGLNYEYENVKCNGGYQNAKFETAHSNDTKKSQR